MCIHIYVYMSPFYREHVLEDAVPDVFCGISDGTSMGGTNSDY